MFASPYRFYATENVGSALFNPYQRDSVARFFYKYFFKMYNEHGHNLGVVFDYTDTAKK